MWEVHNRKPRDTTSESVSERERTTKREERKGEDMWNPTTQTPHIRAKKKQLAVKNTHTHKNTKTQKKKTK